MDRNLSIRDEHARGLMDSEDGLHGRGQFQLQGDVA